MTLQVSNFAPELIEVYRRAARRRVEIPCPSRQQAFNLRHRLYQLREAMKREDHYLLPAAMRISLYLPPNSSVLTAATADEKYIGPIREALGIAEGDFQEDDTEDPQEEPSEELSEDSTPLSSETEKVLKDMFGTEAIDKRSG